MAEITAAGLSFLFSCSLAAVTAAGAAIAAETTVVVAAATTTAADVAADYAHFHPITKAAAFGQRLNLLSEILRFFADFVAFANLTEHFHDKLHLNTKTETASPLNGAAPLTRLRSFAVARELFQ